MDIESTLHKLLFENLSHDKFSQTWEDEIGRLEDEVCAETLCIKLPKYGKSTIYRFKGGLVALESSKGKWSAFETLERVEEREYYEEWARFVRGGWTYTLPQEAGVYPVKDREGNRSRDRTLIRLNGRLCDVTCCGGMVQYGQVTNWMGLWYTMPYPKLRNENELP